MGFRKFSFSLVIAISLAACEQSQPKTYAFSPEDVEGKALIAKGERLTRVLGCQGCHDETLVGGEWVNEPAFGVLYSSNLTHTVQRLSDAQIETIIRTGKRPDGKDVYEMPSEAFTPLSAADMKALLAYLRTLKPAGHDWPAMTVGPEGKKEMAAGRFKPTAVWVKEERGKAPLDVGPKFARGRYLAQMACGECHRPTLAGNDEPFRPDLTLAAGYSKAEFVKFMRTGEAKGGRQLELMSKVARGRFSQLTDDEVDAIYAYLVERAKKMP